MANPHLGIDEAGLGPTLGPLVVVGISAQGDFSGLTEHGVKDSKLLHKPKNLRPLAQVAMGVLGWLCGRQPRHAAELLDLLGESVTLPWLADGDLLPLPGAGMAPWIVPDVRPLGWAVRCVHPVSINDETYVTKADLELAQVGALVNALAGPDCEVSVDRLGGRLRYAPAITAWLGESVSIEEESARRSAYFCHGRRFQFLVGGESQHPLIAASSCLAKFVREIHMLQFNRWWCQQVAHLRPTAGYPEDAARWLQDTQSVRNPAIDAMLIRRR